MNFWHVCIVCVLFYAFFWDDEGARHGYPYGEPQWNSPVPVVVPPQMILPVEEPPQLAPREPCEPEVWFVPLDWPEPTPQLLRPAPHWPAPIYEA